MTVGHLVARKRHADVLRALWLLRESHPQLRWAVVGDGPERAALEHLAGELDLAERVDLRGALPPAEAAAAARRGTLFVLPSVDEAFGVAYIEAMAGGVPAIGSRGEAGPEEIAAAGGGIRLVAPGEPARAGGGDPRAARRAGLAARAGRGGARDGGGGVHLGALRPCHRRGVRRGAALKPVLFVTNHAPPFRIGAFAALHEREDVVFALIGGDVRHGGGAGGGGGPAGSGELPFPVIRPSQRAVLRLAASGRFRAVVAGLSGRVALPAAWAGARRAGVPFVLWATIWAHPRTAAHALSYLPLRQLYRDADAIVTYGPHVSAYVRGKGARGPVVEAPQSVDDVFWSGQSEPIRRAEYQVMFAGRLAREKGVRVLLQAWRASGLSAPSTALVLVGDGPIRARTVATGAVTPKAPSRPSVCATSTRAATLSSCRRSPRATSASRGGWSPTKPSTRESP